MSPGALTLSLSHLMGQSKVMLVPPSSSVMMVRKNLFLQRPMEDFLLRASDGKTEAQRRGSLPQVTWPGNG